MLRERAFEIVAENFEAWSGQSSSIYKDELPREQWDVEEGDWEQICDFIACDANLEIGLIDGAKPFGEWKTFGELVDFIVERAP